ncbi:MAG: hypoxanthine-guanine phosphoribosyltransferase, partial [Gallionella sp.]|nr:hypoxanthine-guanine phosphoribosyltransferase [Gallionella sp.]
MLNNQQAREILANAELLHNADAVQAALHHIAARINTALADRHPLVLSVMGGAVVFSGQLLPLLDFPL